MYAEGTQSNLNQKVCLECNRQFTGIVAACPHDGTLLVNIVQDPLIGTTLAGNYEIQEVIGHGGMGVVYKARHSLMDRIVAIKMLQSQLISDSMSVKRFQQESKAASRISHPHVITVYDFGISPNGQPFIVMDYLQGCSLADVIKNEGQCGVERSIKILAQACDALEHAHKQGVIHRDLKPTNIVLVNYDEEKDFVKVVDFGVAKLMNAGPDGQRLTQAGEVCGSPVYMSPEQCTGLELDPRSDIYSMGIVVYETLTGKLPILGKTMVDTMSKHISEMPPSFSEARPDLYIPERLEQVVFKALAKDPNDRHQSMEELMIDLENAIPRPGKSQVLRSTPLEHQSEKVAGVLKQTSIKVWVAVAAVIIFGGLGIFNMVRHHATTPPPAHVTEPAKESAPVNVEPSNTTAPAQATNPVTNTEAVVPTTTSQAKTPTKESITPVSTKPTTTASSPEDIVESAASQERPKIRKKPHHTPKPAVASSVTISKPKPTVSADPFANLAKERTYSH